MQKGCNSLTYRAPTSGPIKACQEGKACEALHVGAPQYSSSRSPAWLPRVASCAHSSMRSHTPAFGWLNAPSSCRACSRARPQAQRELARLLAAQHTAACAPTAYSIWLTTDLLQHGIAACERVAWCS